VKTLNSQDAGFATTFAALLAERDTAQDVHGPVAAIIADVQARGDAALIDYTARFDRLTLTPATLRFTAEEIQTALDAVPAELMAALDLAASRIEAFHRAQLPKDIELTDAAGLCLGMRWGALDAVGLYVPGGKAAYPSSVLMNAIPARVAGVGRIAMVVPTPDGVVNNLVLAAAHRAGVTEVYRVGGAQAVAALAYGTATIAPVDRIVGPGNAYVAEAKRQVFGRVGIDSIAGPSEVLIVADDQNDPRHIAVDLLAQAEHDELAQAVLITNSADFAARVTAAVAAEIPTLPRAAIAGTSWRDHGAVIIVRDWDEAAALVNHAPSLPRCATLVPPSLVGSARKRWAIMLAVRTTCCPPGGRRGLPLACRCTTSSSAPPGSKPTKPPSRRSAQRRWLWRKPRVCRHMAALCRSDLGIAHLCNALLDVH